MKSILTLAVFIIQISSGPASSGVPGIINVSKKYLFYLHGAIVQEMGINAVSEDFGAYEYLKILAAFSNNGFIVISEVRPKGTDVLKYADNVSAQIDTLLKSGVPPDHIIVVGASQGAYITMEVAHLQKNQKIRYVIMALCNDYNVNFYLKYYHELCGDFLSIYETTDQKKSCDRLLDNPSCKSGYQEIKLAMGNGHGFIFKPYKEWVDPLVKWINQKP